MDNTVVLYCNMIALGLKFHRDTPENVRNKIIDFANCDDSSLPVGLQPYQELLDIYEKYLHVARKFNYIYEQDREGTVKLIQEFMDMSEEEFVDWYRNRRKDGKN